MNTLFINSYTPVSAHYVELETSGEVRFSREAYSLSSIAQRFIDSQLSNSTSENQNVCSLILSDDLVSSYQLDLVTRNRQQLQKAASYAVEEHLPLSIDEYHIIAQRKSTNKTAVRCVPHKKLNDLLEHFSDYNLNIQSIFLESDLLAANETHLIIKEESTCLYSPHKEHTLDIDNDVLALFTDQINATVELDNEVNIISTESQETLRQGLLAALPGDVRIRNIIRNEAYIESLAKNTDSKDAINLLQGEYKANFDSKGDRHFWFYPAALAIISGLLFSGGLVAQNLYLKHKNSNKQEQLIQQYTDLYPQSRKPRDFNELGNLLRTKQAIPTTQESGPNALNVLASIANSSQQYTIRLVGFNYENKLCDLVVSGPNIEAINSFKDAISIDLQKLGSQNTELSAVNAKDDSYQGKFKIQF